MRDGDRNILTVRTRYERFNGYVGIDNSGSSSSGPIRARLDVNFNGLLTAGDQLSLGGVITPLDPDELQLVRARYALPLGRHGTELRFGGYYGHTQAGGELRARDFTGDSAEVDVALAHPLQRSRGDNMWLTGRFTFRSSELDRAGIVIRDDRIATASLTLAAASRLGEAGRLRTRLSATQGLGILGATRRGDPLASRDDAGGVFTRLEVGAEAELPVGGGFSLALAAEAQIASRPLLASEKIGLGGRTFLRAFDYREASGDDGAAGSVELRFDLRDPPRPLRSLQPYVYADAGRVTNQGPQRSSGSLASAGAGIRAGLSEGFHVGVELGVPLTAGVFEREPAPRFSFTISKSF